ncbi:MAG: hypothetical protein WBF71_04125 [Microthrixaceae bacterium]
MTERKKRRHVAKGARIAATGLGVSTMLSLVGAMGYAKQNSASGAVQSANIRQSPVVVVIHRNGSPDTVVGSVPVTPGTATTHGQPTMVDSSAPTVLKARPTVRPSNTRSRVPAASTSGSR